MNCTAGRRSFYGKKDVHRGDQMLRNLVILSSAVCLSALASSVFAQAPASDNGTGAIQGVQPEVNDLVTDIVVTAQKRTDRLRDVPLSINAASGEQLQNAGITSTADLERIVPGFTAINTAFGNPVFFIRGIGFNDTTLGVSPAVSIYMDQQPLSFSPEARGAVLDLERVEVLKGPQGTLFGQNSTGGAINYIAAKPTAVLKEGLDFTYGRFGQADAEGFISAPVSDDLQIRVAARTENRDQWQRGYVGDEQLGSKGFLNGRISVSWEPSNRVSVLLTASGWKDRSEAQQPQFVLYAPARIGQQANPVPFPVAAFPPAPQDARDAAWPRSFDYGLDNWFYQFSGDVEADLTDDLHLNSLTSYNRYHQSVPINYGGTTYPNAFSDDKGRIQTFSQELRLNGELGPAISWMVGANYKWDHVFERQIADPIITSSSIIAGIPFTAYFSDNDQNIKSRSIFGSVDYKIIDQLTLQGSVRYNKEDRDFAGCARDSGNGTLAAGVSRIIGQTIAPGSCVAVSDTLQPLSVVNNSLNQDNLSYRASLNWKPYTDTLLYANITRGYKSGSFPTLPGFFATQLDPIGQESVLAYEAGTKFRLAQKFDVTGAGFYYNYHDKQLLGAKTDPVFGVLPALVSIPESHVAGGEVSLIAGPFSGLTIALNGTYVATRVGSNPVNPTGPFGNSGNFVGQSFPFTPKWQGSANAEYRFSAGQDLTGFGGVEATARSSATAALLSGAPAFSRQEASFRIPGYLVVDLRAGVETADEQWRIELFGRNVSDRFYVTGIKKSADFVTQYTGFPTTYGARIVYRM